MNAIGKTISVTGEVRAGEDITIEGRVEGHVLCEKVAVAVASTGHIVGDVVARDITILGTVSGKLVATDVIDIRLGATVTGQVIAKRFVLADGAHFTGRVEPQHLDAALSISKIEQRKRDAGNVSQGEPRGTSAAEPATHR